MPSLFLTRSIGQPKASDLMDDDLVDLVCHAEIGVYFNLDAAQSALLAEAKNTFGGRDVEAEWAFHKFHTWRLKATARHPAGFVMEFFGSVQEVAL